MVKVFDTRADVVYDRGITKEQVMKTCSKCGEEKSLDEFGRNRASSDGRSGRCLQCVIEVKKKCTKCGEEKALDEFHRNKASKDGRKSRCWKCTSDSYYDCIAIPKALEDCRKEAARYVKQRRSSMVYR